VALPDDRTCKCHIEMDTRVLFPGLKRPWREADHSPPSDVGVKDNGTIPAFSHASSWQSV
jgi:hypothetical protein